MSKMLCFQTKQFQKFVIFLNHCQSFVDEKYFFRVQHFFEYFLNISHQIFAIENNNSHIDLIYQSS